MSHHPFYGITIARAQQEDLIKEILEEYKGQPVSEDLREKVYERLMEEKHQGKVTIPFRVLVRKDPSHYYPPHIEVLLDTSV